MLTMIFLPLVEDPPLAWTGEGFGRELSRSVRVGVIHKAGEYPLCGRIFYQLFSPFSVEKFYFSM